MKYLLLLFILTFPFLLNAQTEVSLLVAPFSIITETKLFFSIGIEVQPSDRWALYMETAIPIKIKDHRVIENETTYSIAAQLRRYSQKKTKYNLHLYLAFEIYHRPRFYERKEGVYFTKTQRRIAFVQAKVGTTDNNLSFKMGSKFISNRRFIFDFNIGFTFAQRTVRYYDVVGSTTASSSFSPLNYTEIVDRVEEDIFLPTIGGSIRIGYLFTKRPLAKTNK